MMALGTNSAWTIFNYRIKDVQLLQQLFYVTNKSHRNAIIFIIVVGDVDTNPSFVGAKSQVIKFIQNSYSENLFFVMKPFLYLQSNLKILFHTIQLK